MIFKLDHGNLGITVCQIDDASGEITVGVSHSGHP